MEIKRDRTSNIKYSLHDAHIKKIEIEKERLILKFDYIFSYSKDGGESTPKADLIFTGIDAEIDGNVYVFDDISEYGFDENKAFSGKIHTLKNFVETYQQIDFVIITETYHGYKTIFHGWLYVGHDIHSCFMTFWNDGDMIYKIYDDNENTIP